MSAQPVSSLSAPRLAVLAALSSLAVHVDLTRQAVKDAPRYDGQPLPDRVQERVLHDHDGRAGYRGDD